MPFRLFGPFLISPFTVRHGMDRDRRINVRPGIRGNDMNRVLHNLGIVARLSFLLWRLM